MSSSIWRLAVNTISWALLVSVAGAALALIVVPKAAGAKPLTVLSGSMAPTYDPGDVVIVRDVGTRDLEVGQVITFQPISDDPRLTTHRVVQVTYGSEGTRYVTQGDANDAPDPDPVRPAQVRGEVWYSVPVVGYLSVWMATGLLGQLVKWIAFGLIAYGVVQVGRGLRQHHQRATSEAQMKGYARPGS
jgi:signal peptidase